jgi:hypothetical protein
MGMILPLGTLYQEDTLLFTSEILANADLTRQTCKYYRRYLSKEQFRSCRIGIPYVVEDRVYDPSDWIMQFLHEIPIESNWFSYMDMSLRHDIKKWNWSFPELGENNILYIKVSRQINWNDFLSSIWDFTKNNINVVLLDTNKVLYHPKYEKLLQSLTLRGVSLGFNGVFPKHWLWGSKGLVKKMSQLQVVDFWQTSIIDSNNRVHQEEIGNKLIYFGQ